MSKVAIIIYSLYHHVSELAESIKAGLEAGGAKGTIFQVPELLSKEILEKMHAPPPRNYPIADAGMLKDLYVI